MSPRTITRGFAGYDEPNGGCDEARAKQQLDPLSFRVPMRHTERVFQWDQGIVLFDDLAPLKRCLKVRSLTETALL